MAKRILLVEDSPDDELLFMAVMKKAGMSNPIFVVHDGREAIAYLAGHLEYADRSRYPLPQILLLDLKMPGPDGFDVLQWVKKQPGFNELLIVVLSHFGSTTDINRAYNLGAHSFLTKPFKHEDLVHLAAHFSGYLDAASGQS